MCAYWRLLLEFKCFELYAIEVSDNQHRRWCEALTFHPVNLRAHSTDFLAEFGNK